MPLPQDPEILKIPAFMRKRSIAARARHPLLLTALDRKKKGTGIWEQKLLKRSKFKIQKRKKKKKEVFSAPIPTLPTQKKQKVIGTVTHYYNKIKVGVIKLSGALCIGDCITYETDEGDYEQVVESIEIDRQPVFKAGRGKEIGIKLRRVPRIGCSVLK